MVNREKKGRLNMTILAKEALPRRITPSTAAEFVGESVCWYCQTCEKRYVTGIQPNGVISCPVCGSDPDWTNKGRTPTLAFESRYRRVVGLCSKDSPWRRWADEVEQQYAEFIGGTYFGMPARTKLTGWWYFASAWREMDKLGDYLLAAPDIHIQEIPRAYSEEGLQRKNYDPIRNCNVVTLSDVGLTPKFDDGGMQYTDEEAIEVVTFNPADCERFMDKYFQYWFLDNIENPLERDIAYWLSEGESKRDIENLYGLSEQQVKTICKHLRNILDKNSLKSA